MYKCSVKSQLVLDSVKKRCHSDTQTDNKWKGRSGNYMFIMGRENSDGRATGVVHKFAPDGVTHKLAGSFKILADGNITRFTGLSKANWNDYMSKAEAEYKNNSELPIGTAGETAKEKIAI
jgi:hypothetical protein